MLSLPVHARLGELNVLPPRELGARVSPTCPVAADSVPNPSRALVLAHPVSAATAIRCILG